MHEHIENIYISFAIKFLLKIIKRQNYVYKKYVKTKKTYR